MPGSPRGPPGGRIALSTVRCARPAGRGRRAATRRPAPALPLLLLVALALLGATPAWPALPLSALVKAAPAAAAAPASAARPASAAASAATEEELQRARAELARIDEQATLSAAAPEAQERRALLARMVVLLGAERRHADDAASAAQPLPPLRLAGALQGQPPYPASEVDRLRDQRDALLTQQQAVQFTLNALEPQLAELAAAQRKADEAVRLRSEYLARAREADDAQRLREPLELAQLQQRVAGLELARADRERGIAQQRMATLGERAAELEREIARVAPHQQVDDAMLAEAAEAGAAVRRRLAAQRRQVQTQLATLEAASRRSPDSDAPAAREAAALRGRIAAIAEAEQIEAGLDQVWQQRRAALDAGADRTRRTAAETTLRRSAEQLAARLRSATEYLDHARATLRVQRLRLEALPADAPQAGAEARVLEALTQQVHAMETAKEALDKAQRLVARSLQDAGTAPGPQSAGAWFADQWATWRGWIEAAWQYELFSLSETVQADGRTVTVDYGVTVGKSVGVLLLFGLGYLAAGLLSRLVIAALVRWLKLSPQLGRVLHRWVLWILLLVVLVAVLKLARIPLTAFAFMGGALAIGVGFGTQNIIKNLISGAIILFERKIRVGDTVTIDGVSGTVSAVDLRATTLLGFDGIESIVPNSQLLENRVSNWSYQNPNVRRSFTVGLSYGQDIRHAAGLVRQCALADTSVLREPAPEVLLDDFGADAPVLRLQYWIRIGGPRGGPTVDSDLRLAIDDAFTQHGLVMAYPQRDVHLDVRGPLPIQLMRGPAA